MTAPNEPRFSDPTGIATIRHAIGPFLPQPSIVAAVFPPAPRRPTISGFQKLRSARTMKRLRKPGT